MDNRVRRLHVTERLEWRDEAHVIGHGLLTLVTGDDPFEEVLGGLLVGFGHLVVDGPVVVARTGRQTLFLFAGQTHVDWDGANHVGLDAFLLQVTPRPGSVLVENTLTESELRGRIITGLGAQFSRRDGGILQIQVERLLELRKISALMVAGCSVTPSSSYDNGMAANCSLKRQSELESNPAEVNAPLTPRSSLCS